MTQDSLFSPLADVDAIRELLGELHDDIAGKVARFRQLADLSVELGADGSLLPGGEITYATWLEARSSFVPGNFVATVMLCHVLAEHTLAAQLEMTMGGERLPQRVAFPRDVAALRADRLSPQASRRGLAAPDVASKSAVALPQPR